MPNEKLTSIAILRRFFGDSRPLETSELRALSKDERLELARLAAVELGVELVEL